MTTLHPNIVVWKMEYLILHWLMSQNSIPIRHNKNIGDIKSIRNLTYSLIRKCLNHLLINEIKIDGSVPNDITSKMHGDLVYQLQLDPRIVTKLKDLFKLLENDEDVIALQEMLYEWKSTRTSTILIDNVNNRLTFNAGKTVKIKSNYYDAPDVLMFFTQLIEFAPLWQRVRLKLDAEFKLTDIGQRLSDRVETITSKLELFKQMLESRRSAME